MKVLLLLVALLLLSASALIAESDQSPLASPKAQDVTRLWLTVRFDQDLPFNPPTPATRPPYAEVSTLVTINNRFEQQCTVADQGYLIAGVVDAPNADKYPISIMIRGRRSLGGETKVSLKLGESYSVGITDGIMRGLFTIILNRAPEWPQSNGTIKLVPTSTQTTTSQETPSGKSRNILIPPQSEVQQQQRIGEVNHVNDNHRAN